MEKLKIKFGWISRLWRTKTEIQNETMRRVRPIYPTQEPPPYLCTNCGKYSETQYICSQCQQRMK